MPEIALAAGVRSEILARMLRGWLTILLLLLASAGAVVRYDMSRAELLQELGKPVSALVRGDREILIYPNNVRIEIAQGKVVSVKGLDLAAQEAVAAATPAPADEADPEETAPAEPKLTPEEQKARAEAEAKLEKTLAEAEAKGRAEMEKTITDLENLGHSDEKPVVSSFSFTGFLTELFIKWALMLAALKLTCKYWGADVDWSGLMLAAAADTGVRALIGVIGYVVLEMFSLLYADEAIAAVVLVLVLRKVSTNQSLQQAVTITMTSKVFSIVVGSFVTTVVLHALH